MRVLVATKHLSGQHDQDVRRIRQSAVKSLLADMLPVPEYPDISWAEIRSGHAVLKHLPGQHDQSSHGGGSSVGTHVPPKVGGVESESLTDLEQRAVLAYGGSAFRSINGSLRTGKALSERNQGIIEHLDSAIAKGKTTQEMTVYRGFQSPSVEANWSTLKLGTIVGERGFLSTTTSPIIARRFLQDERGIIAEIRVSKGAKATTLDIAGLGGEGELLLGRQTRMRLVRKSKDSYGNKVMVLDVVS